MKKQHPRAYDNLVTFAKGTMLDFTPDKLFTNKVLYAFFDSKGIFCTVQRRVNEHKTTRFTGHVDADEEDVCTEIVSNNIDRPYAERDAFMFAFDLLETRIGNFLYF